MISSCMPSEGKSLLNIIFAQTLCELGKKILLIDIKDSFDKETILLFEINIVNL